MKPYSPERKLLASVASAEYEITKGTIIGMYDGRHGPEGESEDGGDGEIYLVKVVESKVYKVGSAILIWPEFLETFRKK